MNDRPEWFAPKAYGIGAGLPIAWQGWALLGAYLALMMAAGTWLSRKPLAMGAAILIVTVVFVGIAGLTTRGGWKWRWGRKDGK